MTITSAVHAASLSEAKDTFHIVMTSLVRNLLSSRSQIIIQSKLHH